MKIIKKILIIGSSLLADSYIREKKLKTKDYKYIKFYNDIYGYSNREIILLGGYDRKVDWEKIEQYCYSHNIKKKYV